MTCARYRSLLSRYVDGEETPRQRSELLAHVESCPDCAAWLARARQADVLLKGGTGTAHPSDRVRSAVLGAVKGATVALPKQAHTGRVRMAFSQLLLRLDPAPRHYILVLLALFATLAGGAYWLGLIPLGGYSQLGFVLPEEGGAARINATPLPAVSRGAFGVGGPAAVPNILRTTPDDGAAGIATDSTLGARFDQPMDRRSVERSFGVDPPLSGEFSWGADNELSFTPAHPMLLGITYTVTLTGSARSLHGIPVASPLRWSFRTRDPLALSISPEAGTSLAPTSTLTLRFESAMARDGLELSLKDALSGLDIPASREWNEEGTALTLTPNGPLPTGTVRLWVGGGSSTIGGEALGRAHEASYTVDAPAPRLQLAGGRVRVLDAASLGESYIEYSAAMNEAGAPPSSLTFDLYSIGVERLAALGPQSEQRRWPAPIPLGIRDSLQPVKTMHLGMGSIGRGIGRLATPALPPGVYLIVATMPSAGGTRSDWQALIVADGGLALTPGGLLWATDVSGRAWIGGEVLLFGPDGALLRSGATDGRGVWVPDGGPVGATLAIVRGPGSSLAAAIWDPAIAASAPQGNLDARLRTDREVYRPGDTVLFRVQAGLPTPAPASRPEPAGVASAGQVTGEDLQIALLHPNRSPLLRLTLTTDEMGGASGTLALPEGAAEGEYLVRVQLGDRWRDFPIRVAAPSSESLSVLALPEYEVITNTVRITHTVSVLGPTGEPAANSIVTGTLRLEGDWTSEPVTATTDALGRSPVAIDVPDWANRHPDPSLAFVAEARRGESTGTHVSYPYLRPVPPGTETVASPSLNIAARTEPGDDGTIRVTLSRLDRQDEASETLLVAHSPEGERAVWVVSTSGRSSVDIPAAFREGRAMIVGRSGLAREISLPAENPGELNIKAPTSVLPNTIFSPTLTLTGAGVATLWFERAGSVPLGDAASGWTSGVELKAGEPMLTAIGAPDAPGLWHLVAEAAGPDRQVSQARRAVRVLPGVSVQVSPAQVGKVGEESLVRITVHNWSTRTLSSGLRLESGPSMRVAGWGSQALNVGAGRSQALEWRYVPDVAGRGALNFSFMPSAGLDGIWSLPVEAGESEHTAVTYVSGTADEGRKVGVQVPSGLAPDRVRLEIRASTHLLPALSGIAAAPLPFEVGSVGEIARLGSTASVRSAYGRTASAAPEELEVNSGQRAMILDTLYSAQRPDGGWAASPDGAGSALTTTAGVLLSLRREALLLGDTVALPPDAEASKRGLAYLRTEVLRPAATAAGMLDARAYALYVWSLYGDLPLSVAHSYLQYARADLGEQGLSRAGIAWLALALHHAGDHGTERLLLERLLAGDVAQPLEGVAPLIELLLHAADGTHGSTEGRAGANEPDYMEIAKGYANRLMSNRRGAGWGDAYATADALWALSLYAARLGSGPDSVKPALFIDGRIVEAQSEGEKGSVQVVLTGSSLHPGLNWLELRPTSGDTLYYSLTLRATR